jgi:hypothetical protein
MDVNTDRGHFDQYLTHHHHAQTRIDNNGTTMVDLIHRLDALPHEPPSKPTIS